MTEITLLAELLTILTSAVSWLNVSGLFPGILLVDELDPSLTLGG